MRGAAGAPIEANIQAMTSFEPRVDVKVLGGRAGHQGHFSLQAQPWLAEELLLVVEDRMGASQTVTLQFGIARSESEVHWLETLLRPSEEGALKRYGGRRSRFDVVMVLEHQEAAAQEPQMAQEVLAVLGYAGLRLYADSRAAVCPEALTSELAEYTDKRRVSS